VSEKKTFPNESANQCLNFLFPKGEAQLTFNQDHFVSLQLCLSVIFVMKWIAIFKLPKSGHHSRISMIIFEEEVWGLQAINEWMVEQVGRCLIWKCIWNHTLSGV